MDTYNLRLLCLTLLLGSVMSKKYKVGPCVVVTDSEPCPDPEIEVYLYTKKDKNGKKVDYDEKSDLGKTTFDPNNPNKIIIHGYNSNMNLGDLQNIKTEYLNSDTDLNVWMVNYKNLVANGWCYLTAVKNISHVGKCLALFMDMLRRHKANYIHAVAFSLGAQATNYIAKHLKGNKLDRITGLDPAGPGFMLMSNDRRLDPSDAKFVDVIHTNGGIQGYMQACGDVDFYMNGGMEQPGCINNKKDFLSCNHHRAPQYFAESINSKVGFLGWKCTGYSELILGKCKEETEETVRLGEHVPPGTKGIFEIPTNDKKPFAKGKPI